MQLNNILSSTFKGDFKIDRHYIGKEEQTEIFKPIHLISDVKEQNIHIFSKSCCSLSSFCDFTVFYHFCSGSFPNDIYFLYSYCFEHLV